MVGSRVNYGRWMVISEEGRRVAIIIINIIIIIIIFFFFQAEDGIRDHCVTGVQTCALPI